MTSRIKTVHVYALHIHYLYVLLYMYDPQTNMRFISIGWKLGQGGYGTVHLSEWNGTLLTLVVVKRVPAYQDIDMGEI